MHEISLALYGQSKFSPAFDWIAPSGRIHLSDMLPRALPSAKMIQTFGLQAIEPLGAKQIWLVGVSYTARPNALPKFFWS